MKILYTLLFMLLFSALEGRAQTTKNHDSGAYFSDFYVMEVKPMQFEISYKWPKTDRVMVRITDGEKNIIFAEKTMVYKKYHKYFDMSTMADGKYTFELADGDNRFTQTFVIATKTERVATAL